MKNFLDDLISQFHQILGEANHLVPKLILGFAVLFIFIFLGRKMKIWVHRLLDTKSDDPILTNFLAAIAKVLMILIGILSFLQIVGLEKLVTSILATAGVSAFIIGFAFKDIGENFLAGMMMAFNRPFKLGDIIQINGYKGKIIKLSFRQTQIKTADGIDVYIPNSIMLKNPLQNFTIDGFIRFDFALKILDHQKVDQAIEVTLDSLAKIEGILDGERRPTVGIKNLSGKQYELDVHYWRDTFISEESHKAARSKVIKAVSHRLIKEGIELG